MPQTDFDAPSSIPAGSQRDRGAREEGGPYSSKKNLGAPLKQPWVPPKSSPLPGAPSGSTRADAEWVAWPKVQGLGFRV